jgi:sec-independent protein translocase protein TatA
MGLSFSHLLLVLLVVVILFGRGRIANVMGEIGKGVRSMREGLKGEDEKKE